eukprot:CAMPEP_0119106850 /NCGR_PEP_ID=MMETSP1180-20130426/6405_1 /TAXON_ID=3052 ORGANISM="Chlamydomonas cf sp, Strain CCMP681" /NCGR_SAMPLE_ID=MMETSP1180 /ASSEMBLY_ACC=CAM_ASM_000741 /LENGTH=313 /DNA_ID=CAMNT_0007092245 /DNA_START=52 /DNA_END=993 /DNA_ORIENTATION=+
MAMRLQRANQWQSSTCATIPRASHPARRVTVTGHRPVPVPVLVSAGLRSCFSVTPNLLRSRSAPHSVTRTRRAAVVQASWGAPVTFSTAKVVRTKLIAPGMHCILVDIGLDLVAAYTKPGQYIQAKVQEADKAAFFAIASPPDLNQSTVELLIKVQPGSTAETICGLEQGAKLSVSPVQGKGYPIDTVPAEQFPTLLLFATGSGISPIKALIESGLLEVSKRKEVHLFYGTQDAEFTAYTELIPVWNALGIKVHQVLSGNTNTYVQNALEKHAEKLLAHPTKTAVILCGQKEMCAAVTEICKNRGVEQFLTNF